MPLKKDGIGKRSVAMELELPGTPEEVWQAMATGPGYAAWFVPATIEEKVGGTITFDFGQGASSGGTVTVWEPPHRFAYEEYNWSGEAPPVATEVTIEARSGGTCTMRMVHSLFTERDDWDKELEGFEKGWPGFFRVLRIYLAAFAGQHAAAVMVRGAHPGSVEDAWQALRGQLGLTAAAPGDAVDTAKAGAPRLIGSLDHVEQRSSHAEVLLRLDAPTQGTAVLGVFAAGETTAVGMSLYFYGDEADATRAAEQPKWEAWMEKNFKVAQAAG